MRFAKGAAVYGLDATVRALKITPPAAFAGPPHSPQKAHVNSAAAPLEMLENRLKNKTFRPVQVIIENSMI
jgi:hypothetical protein